jgi:hypothetical protein
MIHNEILLIGRLKNRGVREKINNQNALCLVLAIPNDEDYNLNPNNVAVHYITDNYKMFYGMIGESFAINGHIDARWGKRIICDSIALLKNIKND